MRARKRKSAGDYATYVSRSVYDGVRKIAPKAAAQLKAHAVKTRRRTPRRPAKQ